MSRTTDLSHALEVSVILTTPVTASQSYIPSFTTGDLIHGAVSVVARSDVTFEDLQVAFTGVQSTTVRGAIPNKAHHQFLTILQALDDSTLPTPKTFKKGDTHQLSFTFRVVDYLPTSSCLHSSDNPLVRMAHLQLPPSLGDASIAGFGGTLRDDLAPPDCRIEYSIQVVLNKANSRTSKRDAILLTRQKVRIKPSAGDMALPEFTLNPLDNNYPPRYKVAINHKTSGLPMGHLSIDLQQPDRFWLPLRDPHTEIIRPAQLNLTYIPGASWQPTSNPTLPTVKSLRGQITATTLYTTTIVRDSPPSPHLCRKETDLFGKPLNFYDAAVQLPIPAPPKLKWFYNNLSGSDQPSVSSTKPRLSDPDQGYYTASLMVPVTLGHVNYLPTFQSCFISRIYHLDLQLEVAQAESVPLKKIKLRVPLQISARRDPSVLPSYNASLGVVYADS